MKRQAPRARKQRGFTLVEMSVTMAAAGLLFAAVTTGQELIDQAKAAKLVNDVKSIEAQIQQYANFKGRMPGDCDADGIIDYDAGKATTAQSSRLDTENNARASEYSYSVLLPSIPADGVSVGTTENAACALVGAGTGTSPYDVGTSEANANTWLNDLKLTGVISDSVPNRKFAKLVHEDFAFVGHVKDASATTASAAVGAQYNALVIHNVPQWMARRVATAINGQDARADRSRVRILDRDTPDGVYTTKWVDLGPTLAGGDNNTMRDAMVTIVYFFDRVPESRAGGVIPS